MKTARTLEDNCEISLEWSLAWLKRGVSKKMARNALGSPQ
jgi:hypothetical protein